MQQSLEQYLPEYTDLFYVDYREDLDEHEEIQEKCIRSNSLEALYEKVYEWYEDQERENMQEYLEQVRKNMESCGLQDVFHECEEKRLSQINFEVTPKSWTS